MVNSGRGTYTTGGIAKQYERKFLVISAEGINSAVGLQQGMVENTNEN